MSATSSSTRRNPNIVYAASYARGVWRSNDAGATWTQIKASLNAAIIQTRPAIDVNRCPTARPACTSTRAHRRRRPVLAALPQRRRGHRRAGVHRPDELRARKPGFATFNLCTGQCWYDQFVYTPKGHPDIVYAGGSYSYGETIANKRAVILSTDAGVSGTDMTFDGTDPLHPNGLHPDQHDLVTNPRTRSTSSRRTTVA